MCNQHLLISPSFISRYFVPSHLFMMDMSCLSLFPINFLLQVGDLVGTSFTPYAHAFVDASVTLSPCGNSICFSIVNS